MIHSIQTNKLILICDICGKKKVYLNESAYQITGKPIFGEKGNYEYAKIKDGWMIRNHHCRCAKCKGKKVEIKKLLKLPPIMPKQNPNNKGRKH